MLPLLLHCHCQQESTCDTRHTKNTLPFPHMLPVPSLHRYVRQDSQLWSALHDGMLTTGVLSMSLCLPLTYLQQLCVLPMRLCVCLCGESAPAHTLWHTYTPAVSQPHKHTSLLTMLGVSRNHNQTGRLKAALGMHESAAASVIGIHPGSVSGVGRLHNDHVCSHVAGRL